MANTTSLTPPLLIKVPVRSQEIERSCIYVLRVSILELFRQCSIYFSYLYQIY